MKNLVFITLFGLILGWSATAQNKTAKNLYQLPQGMTADDYQVGLVVLKLKEQHRPFAQDGEINLAALHDALAPFGDYSFTRLFPHSPRPTEDRDHLGRKLVDITLIYELKLNESVAIPQVIRALLPLGIFDYVEPKILDKITFIPNDPEINDQWHLDLLKAFDAWDITTGDTNVKVGVIDTGIDPDHLDLRHNIAYNHQDPINGFDDDMDGYVDNFRGWNLPSNNNDPSISDNDHGVHVSGCVSAGTNNNIGGAGIGWNTRILPIKGGSGNSISRGYEGIVYAADQGCDFINCSWGSYFKSQFNQDIINYATINQGALVFGGAGNRGTDDVFYPAAYQHVMSVGATTITNARAGFSNFGYTVDVFAPGDDIWSTLDSSKYGFNQGTSMSSPMAAGCAALVKAQFPWMTPQQCGEQIRVTAMNIDSVTPNQSLAGQLGRGRVDLIKALSGMNTPSVVLLDAIITDDNDEVYIPGDTVYYSASFLNYLAPTGTLNALMTTASPDVTIINGSVTLGVMNTLENKDNYNNRFAVVINNSVAVNEEITFRVRLTDGTYQEDYRWSILVNRDYLNIAENRIHTSMIGNGRVGYRDAAGTLGLGLSLDGTISRIYEAGLMVGQNTGTAKVVDAVTGEPNQIDDDFRPLLAPFRVMNGPVSDFDGRGRFDDSQAGADNLGLTIDQRSFAWNDLGHRNYVIFEYTLHNPSASDLLALHSGMYTDWDIVIANRNKAFYMPERLMGYCQYTIASGAGLFGGVQLLTPGFFYTYSLDLVGGGNGGVDIFDVGGFSSEDKFTSMSTNRPSAGTNSTNGNDVAQVVATGPFDVLAGDSIKVAFAIHMHESLDSLAASADSAYLRYNGQLPVSAPELTEGQNNWRVFPNPSQGLLTLQGQVAAGEKVEFRLMTLEGRTVRALQLSGQPQNANQFELNLEGLPAGIYLWQVSGNTMVKTDRLVLLD
ncbi:MAG: S8 family serine peptidase [Salibacteraceae bacterium]